MNIVGHFEGDKSLELGDALSAIDVLKRIEPIRDFAKQVQSAASQIEPQMSRGSFAPGVQAALAELILEGLHCHNRLNKKRKGGAAVYGQ